MITPERKTIVMAADLLLRELLGTEKHSDDKGETYIERETAELLLLAYRNVERCYVQLPEDEYAFTIFGKKLDKPRLWRLSYWQISVERQLAANKRSAVEREQRLIHNFNVRRLTNAIRAKLRLTEEQAKGVAQEMLRNDYETLKPSLQHFGIDKLATTMKEVS